MERSGYRLGLADGQGWMLAGARELAPWLAELASIMELAKGDAYGHLPLIFLAAKRAQAPRGTEPPLQQIEPPLRAALPPHGWSASSLGALTFWKHVDRDDIVVEVPPSPADRTASTGAMWLALDCIMRAAQAKGGLAFHGALAEFKGKGVIIAGEGGTGKSTACRRLPAPWRVLCDDTTLAVLDSEGHYHCHPFPTWSDIWVRGLEKTWCVERHVPLSLAVFIEQSPRDEVIPLGQGSASVRMYESAFQASFIHKEKDSHRSSSLKKELYNNACALALAVPSCILKVSLEGRFWDNMESALGSEGC
jgi:SynChlorMet cassette protein ScmC